MSKRLKNSCAAISKKQFSFILFFCSCSHFWLLLHFMQTEEQEKKYDENQNPTWIQWKNGKRSTHNGIMEWWRTQMGIWRGKFVVVECSLYARDYYGKSNLDKLLPKYISHIAHSPLICHRPCRSHIFFFVRSVFFSVSFSWFYWKVFFFFSFSTKIWKHMKIIRWLHAYNIKYCVPWLLSHFIMRIIIRNHKLVFMIANNSLFSNIKSDAENVRFVFVKLKYTKTNDSKAMNCCSVGIRSKYSKYFVRILFENW